MHTLYNAAICIYGWLIYLASLFSTKARQRLKGSRISISAIKDMHWGASDKIVWVHAASLGEFEQGRSMIEKLRAEYSSIKIVLSFFSPSGYEIRKNYENVDLVVYMPLDTPKKAKAFVEALNPMMAIFIKYEFWANHLTELKRRNIPTYIISAIFRKEQIFFKPNGVFFANLLHCFTHLFVQNEESATLLKSIDIDNVTIAGDTRFDRVADIARGAKKLHIIEEFVGDTPVIVAGSTWSPDEDLIVQYINDKRGKVKLIIAPHEVNSQRISEVCKRLKCSYTRYTEVKEGVILKSVDCLIIDTIGVLSSVYQYGSVAYIGGGFGVGIHNTLEAATWGMPIVWGPNYHKFKEAKDLIAVGAGYSIRDYTQLEARFNKLIKNRKTEAESAKQYVAEKTGATDVVLKYMKAIIENQ